MIPSAVVNGNSSLPMKFLRRSSSGSMPSSAASLSIVSSIQYVASGRPAPRIASVQILFVNTPSIVMSIAGIL